MSALDDLLATINRTAMNSPGVQDHPEFTALMQQIQNYKPGIATPQTSKLIDQFLGAPPSYASEAARGTNVQQVVGSLPQGPTGAYQPTLAPSSLGAPSAILGTSGTPNYTGNSTPNSGGNTNDAVTRAMNTIKGHESGGQNIRTKVKGSTGKQASAQGYYQFTDDTWKSAAKEAGVDVSKYPSALSAPEAIQDQVARKKIEGIVAKHGVEAVPLVWYLGHVPTAAEMNVVPRADYGNILTPKQYQDQWMAKYNKGASAGSGTVAGGNSTIDPSNYGSKGAILPTTPVSTTSAPTPYEEATKVGGSLFNTLQSAAINTTKDVLGSPAIGQVSQLQQYINSIGQTPSPTVEATAPPNPANTNVEGKVGSFASTPTDYASTAQNGLPQSNTKLVIPVDYHSEAVKGLGTKAGFSVGGSSAPTAATPVDYFSQIAGNTKSNTTPTAGNSALKGKKASEVLSANEMKVLTTRRTDGSKNVNDLDADFASKLAKMLQDRPGITIFSATRSHEKQQELWNKRKREHPGEPDSVTRKWVAKPGNSRHEKGGAIDLRYASKADIQWAHANASRYGLAFPLSNENWHIETLGSRKK